MKDLSELVRPNILKLKPYSCARDEFKGHAEIFLDANENAYNSPYNRYPDPLQLRVKERISAIKEVPIENITLGVGSDETIDLAFRIFCEPRVDNVVAISPTYGMYEVCANINDVEYRPVSLNNDFSLDANRVLAAVDDHTKLIFLCSPNNPTGNCLNRAEVEKIIRGFSGIVVIDEAYIDFANYPSWTARLNEFPNIIVLQTLSKAWGMASLRCGMAFASKEIIEYYLKVKYPYNINLLTQNQVYQALEDTKQLREWVRLLCSERDRLAKELREIPLIKHIYPSDANFLLVRVDDANAVYNALLQKGIVTRNRTKVALCNGCIRITAGTYLEDSELIEALKEINSTQ